MSNSETQKLDVLIVEDDKHMAEVILRHVEPIKEAYPHAVITVVHDWDSAKVILDAEPPPNAVLLDLTIPGSKMVETIARVDSLEERSAIVIVTGHKMDEIAGRFKSNVEVLFKSDKLFSPGVLIRAIVRALERKSRVEETERFKGLADIVRELHSHGYGTPSSATSPTT